MTAAMNLMYVHSKSIGYGRYGSELAEALTGRGVKIYDHLPGASDPALAHLNQGRTVGTAETVCWVSVPSHATGWWKGQRPVCSTMWEASRLPESFRESLDSFDTIIVPSEHNLELFSQYHKNVKLAYIGYDTDKWKYVERRDPEDEFRFLIGGSGSRKGIDLAVAAFKKCFPAGSWGDGPTPILQMKSPRGREDHYGERIEVFGGRLSDADEVNLYAHAHVYLQPSRGEGFGLQPLQAIAQGLPTILTDAHGHKAFSDLGMPLSYTMEKASYFIYGDAGEWWEPSLDDLCDWMLYSYEHYDVVKREAHRNAIIAEERFNWTQCADEFIDAIGGIESISKPDIDPVEWHTAPIKKYLIVTLKDWKADICGIEHFFRAGSRYWEAADVKRIMFEANLLAPECLPPIISAEEDCGLDERQLSRMDEYLSSKERCPMCAHKMNCEACA